MIQHINIVSTLIVLFNIFGSHSYHIVEQKKTWWDANEHCKNTFNTHLVTITDSTMNANIFSDITEDSWIGYYDFNTEGNWKWIGYNKTTYTHWGTGQPDNDNSAQDCAAFQYSNSLYWKDAYCSNLFHFVCADVNDYADYSGYNPTTSSPTTTYSPTTTPINVFSTTQTISITGVKKVRYNAVCDNLADNYDLKYDITLQECISICHNMGDVCRIINFYNYFKSDDDSRCYIFESTCSVVGVEHNETDQSILYYKVIDDDLCMNFPIDWVDDIGDNCDAYLKYDWCNNGAVMRNENDFEELMNHGLDAIDTCCKCGGGVRIVDNIAVSIDTDWIDYNSDVLCGVTLQNKRDWHNLYLYHFCASMSTDCAYLLNTNFNPTNYSYSIYLCNNSQSEHNDVEFIIDQQINDDHLTHDTYVNLQWFDIDASSYSTNIRVIYLDSTANDTTNEPTYSTTVSGLIPSDSLTINSVSDIVDVPSENLSGSESYDAAFVIVLSVISLCLLTACTMIAFLRRKLNVINMKANAMEEGTE
eukprot:275376_1